MNREDAPEPLKILVAPLDWGLGHASRCIPVIEELRKENMQVILGGTGSSLLLMRNEFPDLPYIEIPGKRIVYGKARWQLMRFIFQIPGFLKSIWNEQQWLKKYLAKNSIDIIISDNRYGLYHSSCFNVIITHQIQPVISKRVDFLNTLAAYSILRFLNRFDELWVPDSESGSRITGRLSKVKMGLSPVVRFTGILSRFAGITYPKPLHPADYLAILSGPEPQRSFLEDEIIRLAERIPGRWIIVRGKPENGKNDEVLPGKRIQWANHINTKNLGPLLMHTPVVIARSGYSTIMDLIALGRTAILVPTPGQKEQEYLGEWMKENRWFYCIEQNKISTLNIQKDENEFALSVTTMDDPEWIVFQKKDLLAGGQRYSVPFIVPQDLIAGLVKNLPGKHKEKVINQESSQVT